MAKAMPAMPKKGANLGVNSAVDMVERPEGGRRCGSSDGGVTFSCAAVGCEGR